MKRLFIGVLLLSGCSSQVNRLPNSVDEKSIRKESHEAKRTPWGGYWWSMQRGELVMGWEDGKGRRSWPEADIKKFDTCLDSYSADCKKLFNVIAKDKGVHLSPMMKFDYFVRLQIEKKYGPNNSYKNEYTHAAKWEFDNHYIGENSKHRYWSSRGYAGKCIGWALSTFDYDEPTVEKEIGGVIFKPSDIKGMLAAIYNGAQFFVPEDQVIGKEFRADEKDASVYEDVYPKDFIISLQKTVKQGKMLEADLDPSDGVWNYPVYKYDLMWAPLKKGVIQGSIKIYYPSDEVDLNQVFSITKPREDMRDRTLDFEMKVSSDFDGDFSQVKDNGTWVGDAVEKHPDAVILGLEDNWRTTIYEYKNTEMKQEVNYPLIKRVKVGNKWQPVVDGLIKDYFKKASK